MTQKGLSNALKAIAITMGFCGLLIYIYIVPTVLNGYIDEGQMAQKNMLPLLIPICITSIPVFIALVFGYKIANEIGKDNSFSEKNSTLLKNISYLSMIDTIIVAILSIASFILKLCPGILIMFFILVVVAGIVIFIITATLSHLVLKAAIMKQEQDLTI